LIRGLFSSFRRRTPRLIGAGSRRWSRRSRIILMKSAVRSIGRRRARHSEASASLVAGTLSAFQETWQSRLRKNRETCEFIRQPKSQLGKQKNQGILENVLPPCAGTSTPAAAADSPSKPWPRWYRRRHRFIRWALNIRWRCTVVRFPPVLHALNSTGSRRSSPRPGISGHLRAG
jgi:hypothetical protein